MKIRHRPGPIEDVVIGTTVAGCSRRRFVSRWSSSAPEGARCIRVSEEKVGRTQKLNVGSVSGGDGLGSEPPDSGPDKRDSTWLLIMRRCYQPRLSRHKGSAQSFRRISCVQPFDAQSQERPTCVPALRVARCRPSPRTSRSGSHTRPSGHVGLRAGRTTDGQAGRVRTGSGATLRCRTPVRLLPGESRPPGPLSPVTFGLGAPEVGESLCPVHAKANESSAMSARWSSSARVISSAPLTTVTLPDPGGTPQRCTPPPPRRRRRGAPTRTPSARGDQRHAPRPR